MDRLFHYFRAAPNTLITCVTSNVRGSGGWVIHCDDPSYAAGSTCFAANGIAGCNPAPPPDTIGR